MIVEDLLDLPLRTVLEQYCVLYNSEFGFSWGVVSYELAESLFKEFDVDDDFADRIRIVGLIGSDVLELDKELSNRESVVRIMDDLGVSRKSLD